MRLVKWVISLLITTTLFKALNMKFGDIPPLMKFLNPFVGIWQNAESKKTELN